MSCRVDTSPLIAGSCVVSLYAGLGVTGSELRATTGAGASGAGLLFNDWDTGDDAKEFRALLVTAPSSGALTLNEDGTFSLTGAADGSYSLTYRLFVDGADLGTASASIA
ncbi:Ig-like domain-containing protein, partial [Nostoc sp. NIES-2111]